MSLYTFSKPKERTPPKVNASVNHGLWMITTCQCRIIGCNKCTPQAGLSTVGKAMHAPGAGTIWELSTPFSQFCCDPKTSLKSKFI